MSRGPGPTFTPCPNNLEASRQQRCSVKKTALKTLALITGKHLRWSLFLIVLQAFRVATLSKRDSNTGAFLLRCEIFKKIYFEKYLRTAASEDLSGAATLIFRRYFRSNSLPAFYKVSVLKTSMKFLGKHICWSLFSIIFQTFSPKFY